jgi:hypothetical protein
MEWITEGSAAAGRHEVSWSVRVPVGVNYVVLDAGRTRHVQCLVVIE